MVLPVSVFTKICIFVPVFEEIAEASGDKAIFIKVDVDEAEEIAAKCGISAMPTFKVFKNGEKQDELVGASKDKLQEMIGKL